MKEYQTDQLRNVVVLGHSGAGKTSLSEAALFATGAITRLGKVDDGNTTSDYDPDEVKRQISISLSLIPCEWNEVKINLIDTPGYADFQGQVKEGMRAADGALIIVDAVAGIEVGTDLAWGYADEESLPRMVLINRMDRENADFTAAVEQLRESFGKQCVALQLPIGAEDNFEGVIDLLEMQAFLGEGKDASEIPESLGAEVASYREQLVEAIAETDDDLINKYLEGEELTAEELSTALRAAVISGSVVPILAASATKSIGIARALDALVRYSPSPRDASEVQATDGADGELSLTADSGGPLAVLAFKTTADPYVGKLTYLRVVSGSLKGDSHVWNAKRRTDERLGQLFHLRGKDQEQTPSIAAGDIGAVAKLAETTTGDTLCAKERPIVLPEIASPVPSYSLAVYPKTKADLDKMGAALSRIRDEDPSIRVHRDADTNETILSGLGETHIEVAAERMKRKFGVEVDLVTPKVPYLVTVTNTAKVDVIHKKQSGGHGQYARVALDLAPRERGSGFEFSSSIVGGSVPRQYIPAVEKGVAEAMKEGVLGGYPLTDVKVNLFDGKEHPVDSSEMAFKIAGSVALKQGVKDANPVLLEPIMRISVTVPESHTGDVLSDLNGKRGKVQGMTPQGALTVIEAQVPLAEVQRYATDLRSITQGRAHYTMEMSHYEEVPAHIAQKVIESGDTQAT
ncbi:MAG: elongation factor G [Chloroflexi bacterium]|nr:elongation factor G [Chloroflexota bacterium]